MKRIVATLAPVGTLALLTLTVACGAEEEAAGESAPGSVARSTTLAPTAPTPASTDTTSPSSTSGPETSTTTSGDPAPTTAVPSPAPLVTLRGDGLNDIECGSEPETVIADLTGLLGPPDEDTGWLGVETQVLGFCGPGRQRSV